jgi:hypothetical protein
METHARGKENARAEEARESSLKLSQDSEGCTSCVATFGRNDPSADAASFKKVNERLTDQAKPRLLYVRRDCTEPSKLGRA